MNNILTTTEKAALDALIEKNAGMDEITDYLKSLAGSTGDYIADKSRSGKDMIARIIAAIRNEAPLPPPKPKVTRLGSYTSNLVLPGAGGVLYGGAKRGWPGAFRNVAGGTIGTGIGAIGGGALGALGGPGGAILGASIGGGIGGLEGAYQGVKRASLTEEEMAYLDGCMNKCAGLGLEKEAISRILSRLLKNKAVAKLFSRGARTATRGAPKLLTAGGSALPAVRGTTALTTGGPGAAYIPNWIRGRRPVTDALVKAPNWIRGTRPPKLLTSGESALPALSESALPALRGSSARAAGGSGAAYIPNWIRGHRPVTDALVKAPNWTRGTRPTPSGGGLADLIRKYLGRGSALGGFASGAKHPFNWGAYKGLPYHKHHLAQRLGQLGTEAGILTGGVAGVNQGINDLGDLGDI